MGYIFNFNDAKTYDSWFEDKKNDYIFNLEANMFTDMLSPARGQRLLDIGCGSGKSIEPLLNFGLQISGIDPSPYMLDIAENKFKNKVDLFRGFAEDLPFEDNSFEYSSFFTSLEYTELPAKAIEEACRVTKDKIFVGVLNKFAPCNIATMIKSKFVDSVFSKAQFFSIWELKQLVFSILGKVPVSWRTTPQVPIVSGKYSFFVEDQFLVQKSPFGSMIGMTIKPVPKFKVRPLGVKIKSAARYKPATGFARNIEQE
ncbi:MAG: class I SAM-dependent methyltransferase [Desulfobacteraceae bacterium]|nr:class I SAM-dependent methyltransferase [Desulfobacteraceae bacterium]